MLIDKSTLRLINPRAELVGYNELTHAALHHHECEALCQCHGVWVLEWQGGQRLPLLSPAQGDYEQPSLYHHAEGQASVLDEAPQGGALLSG